MKHWIFPFGMVQPHVPTPTYASFLQSRLSFTVTYRKVAFRIGDRAGFVWKRNAIPNGEDGWVSHSRFRPAYQVWEDGVCVEWVWFEHGERSNRLVQSSHYGTYHLGNPYRGSSVITSDGVFFRAGSAVILFEEVRDLLGWPSHWTATSCEAYRFFTPEEEILFVLRFS